MPKVKIARKYVRELIRYIEWDLEEASGDYGYVGSQDFVTSLNQNTRKLRKRVNKLIKLLKESK